ncbi:ras small GTPase RAC1 [Desmophyllum pertusum]|uniref:Ras small GTPase RAC1 n=1 Tax=Desmophyllum pertusum TaxID=174260 RepID=A0A9W9ZBL3_9CNID|nr:ras small GTPase RAC1 [Desmophyllum pertusum]
MAVAIQPEIVTKETSVYATLELHGHLTRGQMVVDWRGHLGQKPNIKCICLCFDVANRSSFQNVTEKWIPELRPFVPEAPVLLLATKTDLRAGNTASTVSTREGEALATSLGVFEKHSPSKLLGFFKRKSKNSTSAKDDEPLPPELPPAGLAPRVEILSSSFASDWHSMISDTSSADVRISVC